jgi:hypothetical protein
MTFYRKIALSICTALLFLLGVIVGFCCATADDDLVEIWGSIYPEEPIESVISKLGQPSYQLQAGEAWAGCLEYQEFIPDEYKSEHEVFVFLIDSSGPHLLFVFVNYDRQVEFVWSTTT